MKSRIPLTLLVWMTTLLMAGSCGRGVNDETHVSDIRTERPPLMMYLGGRASCTRDASTGQWSPYAIAAFPAFDGLLKQAAQHYSQPVPFLMSCYTKHGELFLFRSDNPTLPQGTDEEGLYATVKLLRQTASPSRVFMAGHSWGAWLAMKTVLEMGGRPLPAIDLFTIDAISHELCRFSRPFNCQSSPADFSDAERNEISSRAEFWANYFETNSFFLHSSAIDEASTNYRMEVRHQLMSTDPNIWGGITREFSNRAF